MGFENMFFCCCFKGFGIEGMPKAVLINKLGIRSESGTAGADANLIGKLGVKGMHNEEQARA